MIATVTYYIAKVMQSTSFFCDSFDNVKQCHALRFFIFITIFFFLLKYCKLSTKALLSVVKC